MFETTVIDVILSILYTGIVTIALNAIGFLLIKKKLEEKLTVYLKNWLKTLNARETRQEKAIVRKDGGKRPVLMEVFDSFIGALAENILPSVLEKFMPNIDGLVDGLVSKISGDKPDGP